MIAAVVVSVCILAGILSVTVAEHGREAKRRRTCYWYMEVPPNPRTPETPPPTYHAHLPAWFTTLYEQSVELRQLRDEAAVSAEEARGNAQECEAELATALLTEYCCDTPSPPAYLTEAGLVPTNTHCESCHQGLRSKEYVVKQPDAELAAELRGELSCHLDRKHGEQLIAHRHNQQLLQLGCPHPLWVTADEQLIPPWSPLRWTGNHRETCNWCDTPRTWHRGEVTAGPQHFGPGGTWCTELAIQLWDLVDIPNN